MDSGIIFSFGIFYLQYPQAICSAIPFVTDVTTRVCLCQVNLRLRWYHRLKGEFVETLFSRPDCIVVWILVLFG